MKFNKKYKSKVLKYLACNLACYRTKLVYYKMAAKIALLDASTLSWLQGVGREK